MPFHYEFVCDDCGGLSFVATSRFPESCPVGHRQFRRRYNPPGIIRGWNGGYSPAVGRHVSNTREFDDALKAASDRASEQLGMEHRFRRIDPRDRDATRVTGA